MQPKIAPAQPRHKDGLETHLRGAQHRTMGDAEEEWLDYGGDDEEVAAVSAPTSAGSAGAAGKAAPAADRAADAASVARKAPAEPSASGGVDQPSSAAAGASEGEYSALMAALSKGSAATTSAAKAESSNSSGSRTIMLSDIPEGLCAGDKLRSHFFRYGDVENVRCQASQQKAFVRFSASGGAHRAFVNRAPVLGDKRIVLFRVPDHDVAGQAEAEKEAVQCPNREVDQDAPAPAAASASSTDLVDHDKPAAQVPSGGAEEQQCGISAAEAHGPAAAAGGSSLYGDIDLSAGAAAPRKGSFSGPARSRPEKRTWSRAGLPNMNDKDVLRAKINEKKAQIKVKASKEEVKRLMGEFAKQNEQFKLIGNDSKTIGKNLRVELMQNMNLLTMQLKSSQAAIKAANNSLETARKTLQAAIEKSKRPAEDASASSSVVPAAALQPGPGAGHASGTAHATGASTDGPSRT